MNKEGKKLNDWAIKKIKKEYRDDVLLLIAHNTYRLEKDADKASFSFFYPVSEKAVGLAKTFIIDGVGYDLFPMSWERTERIVELEEDNVSVIADAEILYYRKEEDKKRFLDVQAKLQAHLHDPTFMLNKALEKVNIAMELYQTMMFEETTYKVRKAAGYIMMFLSNAVAYSNMTYFEKGHQNPMSDLMVMKNIPLDFIHLCEAVVNAESSDEIKKLCHDIIWNTRQFLSVKKGKGEETEYNHNFNDLAHWYHELSYAWREIYHWCDQKDAVKAFLRSCYLQSELDIVREEFGLEEFDLLGAFNARSLATYRKQAEVLEKQMISIIEKHGASIEVYDSVEEFLRQNG